MRPNNQTKRRGANPAFFVSALHIRIMDMVPVAFTAAAGNMAMAVIGAGFARLSGTVALMAGAGMFTLTGGFGLVWHLR